MCADEVSPYGLGKRFWRTTNRLAGRWPRGEYDVRIIKSEGQPSYKKVTFDSSEWAVEVYAGLQAFAASPHIPDPIRLDGCDLYSDFVPGQAPEVIDASMLAMLADFYGEIYKNDPKLAILAETALAAEFEWHLQNLKSLHVVDGGDLNQLADYAQSLAPEFVWVGYDYSDPIAPNLVVSDTHGCICAIDIKNLRSNRLIGCGVARALTRWLPQEHQSAFFSALVSAGAPDFSSYFEYVQLFERVQRISGKMAAETKRKGSRKLKRLRRRPLRFRAFLQ